MRHLDNFDERLADSRSDEAGVVQLVSSAEQLIIVRLRRLHEDRLFVVHKQGVGGVFSPCFGLFHIPLVDRDYFLQMRVALKLRVGSDGSDHTIFDHTDAVRQV